MYTKTTNGLFTSTTGNSVNADPEKVISSSVNESDTLLSQNGSESLSYDELRHMRPNNFMVEEAIMYVLLGLLVLFFFTLFVRCIRITLDPYNAVARSAWFETLNKNHLDPI